MTRGGGVPHAKAAPSRMKSMILDERVQGILQMIESGTTFAVGNLAIKFHLSSSYPRRLFKRQTGVSIREL